MKQLPEKIALDKAVQGQRFYHGSIELNDMPRLIGLLAVPDGKTEFSIQFSKASGILGKAQVQVSGDLPLTCKISQETFMFPVNIDSVVGFIDDLAFEDLLDDNMEASWVENGLVKPLEIIEDELILAIPDAPYSEIYFANDVNEESIEVDENIEQISSPFAVLKNLK